MKILKVDYKDRAQKLGVSTDRLVEACRQVAKTCYSVKKSGGYLKILSVDKDKVQVELTKEEVETIESGLGWGDNETGSYEISYSQLQEEFQKIQIKME